MEGLLKIVIFLLYLIFCSKQKDIYRVFQYHGAEHKTIFCYEKGLPAHCGERPNPAQAPPPLRHQLSAGGHQNGGGQLIMLCLG